MYYFECSSEEKNLKFKTFENQLTFNYQIPSEHNRKFLALEYHSKYIFENFDADTIYEILCRLLLDQSFLVISLSKHLLTTTVLGFVELINPFKWPFTIIPFLPNSMKSFVESPVPYVIGIQGNFSDYKFYTKDKEFNNNIIYIEESGLVHIEYKIKFEASFPNLNNLKVKMDKFSKEKKCKLKFLKFFIKFPQNIRYITKFTRIFTTHLGIVWSAILRKVL